MGCETCKDKDKHVDTVPYIVHESDMARQERTIKRLWITILLLIVLLFGSNGAWLWYESQFEESTTITQEVEQTTRNGGDNSFVGGDYFGSAESQNDGD